MPIQLTNGAIFLHIPKTGGSWITRVLDESGLIRQKFGEKHDDWSRTFHFDEYHKTTAGAIRFIAKSVKRTLTRTSLDLAPPPPTFCFVRHPLSWYESWFKYSGERGWPNWGSYTKASQYHPCNPLNGLGDDDFNRFMEKVLNNRPGFVSELYSQFVLPPVSLIGRQENLAVDLMRILTELGVDFNPKQISQFEKVNVSKQASKGIEWDADIKTEVLKTEYLALKRFGYQS